MPYLTAIIAFCNDLVLTLQQNPFGAVLLILLLVALGYCAQSFRGSRTGRQKK